MLDRRQILGLFGASAVASALAACGGGEGAGSSAPIETSRPVGIQLWTVRTLIEKQGPRPVLEALSSMGYKEIEMFDLHGQPLHVWEDMLADTGLAAPSTHSGVDAFENEWQALLERAMRLKHDYVTVSYLAEERRRTLDDYRRFADSFNKYGELAKAAGKKFAFHNHDFEFQPIDGVQPYSILLERTNPELVNFEMDIYWVNKAGVDPLKLIADNPGRFHMAHVKDMAAGDDKAMADVGEGVTDFAAIFAQAKTAGLRHLFVERDDTTDPLRTARVSLANLAKMELPAAVEA